MNRGRFAVIIPVYNHEQRVADVIRGALKLGFPVIAVDDGSTDATTERIQGMAGVSVIRHETNRGKGAALKSGFAAAAAVERRPIIIGRRENMAGEDVPWTSRFGRKFSNFWVRASGGPAVTDSQSGFRIYPLPQSGNMRVRANRFQFEVEILARAGWMGYPIIEAPISVSYTPGTPRISHFRPIVDFWRNSGTFMRLIFQRLLVPRFIRRRMSYKA